MKCFLSRIFDQKEEETGMEQLNVASPWVTFARKVYKLFETDPEVKLEWSDENVELKLYVTSQEKADALTKILPMEKAFGNVTMKVTVVPANPTEESLMKTFEKAFKGNPAVSYTETIGAYGGQFNYIVFQPEVVQYFNDNMADIHGIESTLYQDIANEVFEEHAGIFFCTDLEDQTFLGRPLGEWP